MEQINWSKCEFMTVEACDATHTHKHTQREQVCEDLSLCSVNLVRARKCQVALLSSEWTTN